MGKGEGRMLPILSVTGQDNAAIRVLFFFSRQSSFASLLIGSALYACMLVTISVALTTPGDTFQTRGSWLTVRIGTTYCADQSRTGRSFIQTLDAQ